MRDKSFAFVHQKNADGTFACEIVRQHHTSQVQSYTVGEIMVNIVRIGNGHVWMKNALLQERDLFRKVAYLPQEAGGFVLIPLFHGLEHTDFRIVLARFHLGLSELVTCFHLFVLCPLATISYSQCNPHRSSVHVQTLTTSLNLELKC